MLDWEVPREWNVRSARIEDLEGRVLVDFSACNLHLVGYSGPVDRIVSRDELSAHIHTLPEQPGLIPYRTGYYADSWGFCLAHAQWESMQDRHYRVVIDSTLEAGSLTYGELHIPGEVDDEVLISAHCCHPSLANDNLSGIVVAAALAAHVRSRKQASELPIPFRSRDHRRHHLARGARRPRQVDQARTDPHLRRRPGQRSIISRAAAQTPGSTAR